MSELITNLQHIYNIKLELKDVLETDSDLFEEYPDIVAEKIAQGGGSSADPWYDGTNVWDMIVNEESSADYVSTTIGENFTVTMGEDENQSEIVEAVEWDYEVEVEENNESVSKTVHVIVNGDPHEQFGNAEDIAQAIEDYPDLEDEMIFPILENATLTASEDPSNDGYDYLLEGDLYAWNLNDCFASVQEITENGFYTTTGLLGVDVNVEGGGITPSGTINISSNGTTDVTSYAYANVNIQNTPSGTESLLLLSNSNTINMSNYSNPATLNVNAPTLINHNQPNEYGFMNSYYLFVPVDPDNDYSPIPFSSEEYINNNVHYILSGPTLSNVTNIKYLLQYYSYNTSDGTWSMDEDDPAQIGSSNGSIVSASYFDENNYAVFSKNFSQGSSQWVCNRWNRHTFKYTDISNYFSPDPDDE